MNRIEVIKKILMQAHLNKPEPKTFNAKSNFGQLMIEAWMKALKDIPTKHLDDLYLFSEGFKSHSGMLTPADMIKAWKNEYRRSVKNLEQKNIPQIPTKTEARQFWKDFNHHIFEKYGGFSAAMNLVKTLRRKAEKDTRFSYVKYPEIHENTPEKVNCDHFAPPAYFKISSNNKIICCFCLNSLLNGKKDGISKKNS